MFARKCDRCGRLYENYMDIEGSSVYAFNRDDTGQALENQVCVKDLCPDCMEQFRHFMDGWTVITKDDFAEMMTCRAKETLAKNENEILKAEVARLRGDTPAVMDGEQLKQGTDGEIETRLQEEGF